MFSIVSDFREGSTPASGVVPCALTRHSVEWSHDNASGEGTEGDTRGGCDPPLDPEPFQPLFIFVLFMLVPFPLIGRRG